MDPEKRKQYTPQKLNYFNDALVVHLMDFPIYYIECISERHFVVAGGGGSAKTGVHNQINILELVPTGDSCAADLVMKFLTPDELPDAIMNGSLMSDLSIVNARLVTGGTQAAIYHMGFDPQKKGFSVTDYEILRDRQIKAEIKTVKCIPGKILTGGVDGQLSLWDISKNSRRVEKHIKAHSKEIDEIDVDLIGQQIVTLSREEGKCAVWNLNGLKLVQEFKKEFINSGTSGAKYNYRSCKFVNTSNSKSSAGTGQSYLLIACNPIPKTGPSKVHKLNGNNYKDYTSTPISMDGIMAMEVDLDGRFMAIGTNTGAVYVFEIRNMKQIYKVEEAHHNAVTSLKFLAPKPESLSLTNSKTCALLSVSIDRRIIIHRPRKTSWTSKLFTLIVIVFLIYVLFFLVSKNFL